ncbi:LytTr DNA-binding domain protein [Listeria rocourtiae FSL F6-920]|nr:LytTr DNA-binding domain protein [Listeria rocourtiae FSL F6-920]
MIRKQNSNCFLIFITSLKDKGLEAINRGILPFAYILKDGHSFSEQVNTVLMNINEFSQSQPEQYLTVKDGANIARYEFSKILYFETLPQNRYNTLLVMTDGQYLLRGNIAKFKQMLKEREGFYSELRSYIIHTQMIRNIHYDTFTIQFVDKSELFLTYKTIQKVKKYLSRNGRQE